MLFTTVLIGLGAAVIRPVVAVAFHGPLATMVVEDGYDKLGFTPMPTNAPSFEELRRRNPGLLNPRGTTTKTCGYFDGVETDSYTCAYGNACVWNTVDYYFGCCSIDSAGNIVASSCLAVNNPYTSCVPYSDASSCTGVCYNENRVCDSTAPFCGVAYLFERTHTYTQYFCNSVMDGATLTVLSTWTTTAESSAVETFAYTKPSTDDSAATTDSYETGTSTTSSITHSTGSTIHITIPKKKKSNAGAIAGGVVGGLVALAAIAAGTILALHKRKKAQRQQAMMEVSQVPN